MEWELWDHDGKDIIAVVKIPKERDRPDVIIYQDRIFHYNENGGWFQETEVGLVRLTALGRDEPWAKA